MKVIVASMGRCGSTFVAQQIASALGVSMDYEQDYRQASYGVTKTHALYEGNTSYESEPLRMVYVYGEVGHIYASLYQYHDWSRRESLFDHFDHMGLNASQQTWLLAELIRNPDKAWEKLIIEDWLGLKRQWGFWFNAPGVTLVHYETMLKRPSVPEIGLKSLLKIDVSLPVKPPATTFTDLPPGLQNAIANAYGSPQWP